MAKTLLLFSQNPEDQIFAAEVAQVAGLSLKTVGDAMEAVQFITTEDAEAVFVDANTEADYQLFEEAIQNTVGLFSDKINANRLHYISDEDLPNVMYLIQSPIFGHYIYRHYGDPKDAGKHYGRIVRNCVADKAFGLDKFFGDQVKIQTVSFKSTKQKQEGVEAVRNYLIAAKFKSRMAAVVANAVDELLMNAMFDAPTDELGKPLYASTARDTDIQLDEKSAVEMKVGFDGSYVAISVSDPFGSLDKTKLMSHISKRYTDEEYKIRTSYAGAGIGLATVFRSGGNFFFVSDAGSRTEVTVFFKRTDSFREFKGQFRFISSQFYF